jgi:hypothetical protein
VGGYVHVNKHYTKGGIIPPFYFTHHQGKATQVVVAVVIPVPVVAVEPVLVKVAQVQAVAISVERKYAANHPWHCPFPDRYRGSSCILFGVFKPASSRHGVCKIFTAGRHP